MGTVTIPGHRRPARVGWIAAWNSGDLERILSRYADDFEIRSPLIAERGFSPTGVLRGKTAIHPYWGGGLQLSPDITRALLPTLERQTDIDGRNFVATRSRIVAHSEASRYPGRALSSTVGGRQPFRSRRGRRLSRLSGGRRTAGPNHPREGFPSASICDGAALRPFARYFGRSHFSARTFHVPSARRHSSLPKGCNSFQNLRSGDPAPEVAPPPLSKTWSVTASSCRRSR